LAGGAVTVRPSSGPTAVDLDALHLAGMPADRAAQALQAANLAVQRTDVGSQSVPAGDVVGTDPAHRASPGETVALQVSVGDKVQIPVDLQGQSLPRAERQLKQLGLKTGQTSGVSRQVIEAGGLDLDAAGIRDGDVVGVQDHDFGDWVDPGTRLDLVYYDSKDDNAS
ncbi:MAG TPA: PASTA domain-containing protein, partial [Thermomicrobiales bacterium]|nr:PASTA domain-containing protein [Thermomicrobiales bacterium]